MIAANFAAYTSENVQYLTYTNLAQLRDSVTSKSITDCSMRSVPGKIKKGLNPI